MESLIRGGYLSSVTPEKEAVDITAPLWLRLERRGDEIRLYHSNNSVDWILDRASVQSFQVDRAFVGLAVVDGDKPIRQTEPAPT